MSVKPTKMRPTGNQASKFQALPVELHLSIFFFFELKPFLLSHGVCKNWKRLLQVTDVHPTRKCMIQLYRQIVNTSGFEKPIKWARENLLPFDRETYVQSLLSQHSFIPEDFCMWMLEWPSSLPIHNIWPGLPFLEYRGDTTERPHGVNWIAYNGSSPKLHAVVYKYKTAESRFVPALLIWRTDKSTTWLVFDQEDPTLFGKIFVIDLRDAQATGAIPYNEEVDDDSSCCEYDIFFHADWIVFMECSWAIRLAYARSPPLPEPIGRPEMSVPTPVRIAFNSLICTEIPAPLWTDRNTPEVKQYLDSA